MNMNITLGQYFPGNSRVHRLDPRTKILLMFAYIVLVFLVKENWVFLFPLLFVVLAVRLSHVPFHYVANSIRPLRFLLIFMAVISLLFTPGEREIVSFWKITITEEAVYQAVYITLRLVILLGGTSLMTLTTSPVSLTEGLERLLKPFARFKFPAHELAMMMTIALRMIPTLMEEAEKVQKAQMARGADFESGNVINRAKSMIPILVPLFVSAFRRADELAMAMESRCYNGGEGRTRMHVLRFRAGDAVAVALLALVGAAVLLVQAF